MSNHGCKIGRTYPKPGKIGPLRTRKAFELDYNPNIKPDAPWPVAPDYRALNGWHSIAFGRMVLGHPKFREDLKGRIKEIILSNPHHTEIDIAMFDTIEPSLNDILKIAANEE